MGYAITKAKISLDELFTWLVVVIVVLNSGYYRTIDSYVPLILLLVVSAFALFFCDTRQKPRLPAMLCVVGLTSGIALSILANFSISNLLSGGRVLATALCCFILINKIDLNYFTHCLSKIIRFVLLLSLLLWLWGNIGGSLPTIKFGEYYDFLIVTAKSAGGRATGCFWEPGVFASIIIITAILEMYFSETSLSFRRMIVYCIGIFITSSTAGFLILFLMLMAFLWKKWKFSNKIVANALFAVIALVLTLYYENIFAFLAEISPEFFGKLVETNSGTTSTRLNAPFANLRIFAESPLFGFGFTDAATLFANQMKFSGVGKIVAQTSTTTQLLSSIGILGVVYALMNFAPVFTMRRNGIGFVESVLISLSVFLIVNKEPHVFIAITWMLMFLLVQRYVCFPKEKHVDKDTKDKT